LVPGSFVQQKSLLSVSATGPSIGSNSSASTCNFGAAAASGTISITSSGSSQVAASAGSKWTPTTLLQLQQQQQSSEQLERAPSIGKGYAPTAIESKQHGGNSAFAALTAIDCIAEEGSSIATDSCAPSCSASRENSAQGGSHYYSTALSSRGSADAPQTPQQHGMSLQSLVTSSSLTKALGLSLLRSRSGGGRSSSGGLFNDDRQDSIKSKSPPASPPACSANSSSSSQQSPCRGEDSPGKQQLLQLLATASGGSVGSISGGDGCTVAAVFLGANDSAAAAAAQTPLDQNARYCQSKQAQLQQDATASESTDAAGNPPSTAAAAVPAKKVRFLLDRPSGLTASRDFSLLYAAPELVRGER
jgi:hypothetical protein